jgi:type I restriction enzyme, R subunit
MKEKDLEDIIEEGLESSGYRSLDYSVYDREMCLIVSELSGFVKETQPDEWEKLSQSYGGETESRFGKIVSEEIRKKGLISVLRGEIKHRGIHFKLCFFEPKSGLNPEHQKLFEANRLTVVRQLHYSTKNENSIDLVLLLNGLPLLTVELKNQLTGQTVKHAIKQYKEDRKPAGEPLLQFKRCLVHFAVDQDLVFMATRLSGYSTRFLPFNKGIKNPINPNGVKTSYLWEDILTPRSLLDILENFVHVSHEKEKVYNEKTKLVEEKQSDVLIFPRYHQLDVIRSLRRTLTGDGAGKNYLVQHTTGSGKSYSIGWLAHMLTSFYQKYSDTERLFDTVIVITDRRVLDSQLQNTIRQLERTKGVVNGVDKTSQQLKEFLEQGKSIVITTIQKFPFISDTIKSLGGNRFAVIVDEVHSSQSGEQKKHLNKALSLETEDNDDLGDLDERILKEMKYRSQLGHVSFFGFTGTPKNKTLEIFGTKGADGIPRSFHSYSMEQSIGEKFTLDVLQNYTTYQRHFELSKHILEDPRFPEKTSLRKLISWVDLHEHNVKEKVSIILDHFGSKTRNKIGGKAKAMIVTSSRQMCVKYKLEVDRQLKEMGTPYQALVAFTGTINEKGIDYTEKSMNPEIAKNIPDALKRPEFKLLIVANKYQTGFDEPLLHTMFVDKTLRGLQAVQTLSRLNRTTKGKTDTFVLDFVNSPEDIEEAFAPYYGETTLESTTDPNRLYQLQSEIEEFHLFNEDERDSFCEIFLDPNRSDAEFIPILDRVAERWTRIEDEEIREDFRSKASSFCRLYGYVSQIADFFETDWEKLYMFLRSVLKKLPRPDRVDIHELLDSVDLDYFRLEKQFEGTIAVHEPTVLPPVTIGDGAVSEEEEDFLSAILNRINEVYATEFSDEDKVALEEFAKRMQTKKELDAVHLGDNSPTNKRNKFTEEVDKEMLTFVNERVGLYNKLMDNPDLKKTLFGMLYEQYLNEKGFSRV